jgi:hypothetical protein
MSTSSSHLTSTQHLHEQHLGDSFHSAIPACLREVDRIGFQPDPNIPLFEKCDGDNLLLAAVKPLLQGLGFTQVLSPYDDRETWLNFGRDPGASEELRGEAML